MRPKPTREEVADAITRIEYYRDAWVEDFNVLKNAYLAQEEELDRLQLDPSQRFHIHALGSHIDSLQAENKALRVELDSYYHAWCASDPEGNPSSSG